jgi:hypothetical protein
MVQSFTRADFSLADDRGIEASIWICEDAVRLKASIVATDNTLRAELPSLRRIYRYDPATIAATIETFSREFEELADVTVPWALLPPYR